MLCARTVHVHEPPGGSPAPRRRLQVRHDRARQRRGSLEAAILAADRPAAVPADRHPALALAHEELPLATERRVADTRDRERRTRDHGARSNSGARGARQVSSRVARSRRTRATMPPDDGGDDGDDRDPRARRTRRRELARAPPALAGRGQHIGVSRDARRRGRSAGRRRRAPAAHRRSGDTCPGRVRRRRARRLGRVGPRARGEGAPPGRAVGHVRGARGAAAWRRRGARPPRDRAPARGRRRRSTRADRRHRRARRARSIAASASCGAARSRGR